MPDGGTIPNLGDFTLIKKDDYDGQIDLLVGGTPCQDLSIAGKRLGFGGKRSVLALDFVRLCFETGTRWVLWENVPAERAGCCGKMSPRHFQATTERTSQDLFLSSAAGTSPCRMTVGGSQGSSPELPVISVYAGEYLTLNTPEFPNFQGRSRSEGSVSSLSDILIIGNIPLKYYLTVKCAEGILRRAERRGKPLPPVLKAALIRQSQSGCGAENREGARELSSEMT